MPGIKTILQSQCSFSWCGFVVFKWNSQKALLVRFQQAKKPERFFFLIIHLIGFLNCMPNQNDQIELLRLLGTNYEDWRMKNSRPVPLQRLQKHQRFKMIKTHRQFLLSDSLIIMSVHLLNRFNGFGQMQCTFGRMLTNHTRTFNKIYFLHFLCHASIDLLSAIQS